MSTVDDREVDAAKEESRRIAEKKREELTQMRLQQARELADLESQIKEAIQKKLALSNAEGKVEVEKRRAELEKIQQDLEIQTELRRSQLDDSSEIIKNAEKLRRKKELEAMNKATLEMHQKLHEAKLAEEERLQQLDEKRQEEQNGRHHGEP